MESKGRKTNLGGFWRERERSDGERETLGTVFRSSFNNWIIISLETWPRTGKEGERQHQAEDDTLLPPCDLIMSPLWHPVSESVCVCARAHASVCVCVHMLIGVCMIYNCNLSLSHRYGLASVMGRKRGLLDVRKESISLCHTNYTHIHPQTQNQTLSSCQAESFLGLTLIYELWGGEEKRGLDVDGWRERNVALRLMYEHWG